jgi:glycosyltransferase involved in cell wall biosynthesis
VKAARPLRVLWVIKGLGPGGAERLLVEQATAGDHASVDYEVAYVLDWKRHLVPQLEELGVVTHALGVRSELDPRWVVRLAQLLRRGRYDVVHAHSPVVAAPARVLTHTIARHHGRRPAFVYTEHNRWPSYKPTTRCANAATFALNDAVFTVSDDVRATLPSRARARSEVVVHGVSVPQVRAELSARAAVRTELAVGARELLAVTVANLRAGKNYPGLVRAAQLVVERGAPVRFVAAGQGPLEEEVRHLVKASALGDRFRLLGYRDDATRLIAAADLFVLASHHEGLPVTVMEALTLGVPVVAPAVGGLREIVTDGHNGILVTPGSPEALADGIARAASEHMLDALRRGAAATGDRFSSADAVRHIEATYGGLRR